MSDTKSNSWQGNGFPHWPAADGQSCTILARGQEHLCALAMVEPCRCGEGPYHGARGVTIADSCERCGRLTWEQIAHIVRKFGTRVLPPGVGA